jgi:hypothetical protein
MEYFYGKLHFFFVINAFLFVFNIKNNRSKRGDFCVARNVFLRETVGGGRIKISGQSVVLFRI